MSFWDNTRRLHRRVKPLYTNKNLFEDSLNWCYLEPAILESRNFKVLGGLVPPHFSWYQKRLAFLTSGSTINGNNPELSTSSGLLSFRNLDGLDTSHEEATLTQVAVWPIGVAAHDGAFIAAQFQLVAASDREDVRGPGTDGDRAAVPGRTGRRGYVYQGSGV